MTILDTNVISEVMRSKPSSQVLSWVQAQAPRELFTTAITVAEIYYGIELLPRSKRRQALQAAADRIFTLDFSDRTLAFDGDAAIIFSRICARRRGFGRPISQSDAQIAAIAQANGAVLATHNTADFAQCDIKLVDPWRP